MKSKFLISFQCSSSLKERAKIIHAGLLNPTPEVHRAIVEAEIMGKGMFSKQIFTYFSIQAKFHSTFYFAVNRH